MKQVEKLKVEHTLIRIKKERELLRELKKSFKGNREEFIKDLEKAVYGAKLVSYAQGFALLREAAKEFSWDLDYGSIALLWRGGCIIRSAFLGKIKEAFDNNAELDNLLIDPYFKNKIMEAQAAWRRVSSSSLSNGIPIPALVSALTYFDGYRQVQE